MKVATALMEKYHYVCRDKDGNLFMTTEKCSDKEDAQQYIGDNEVLYPFIEEVYEEAYKVMQNTLKQFSIGI